ncbi:MAG: 2-C-methyl-D-erythritol 2,4-cyclodiphosphate synthase [Desulfobacterales bacterium]
MRIGMGYDVHQLVKGRKLILGGVQIPFEKGLLGHSDADVLLHAICDALLGAAGLGDIGLHFPDTDPAYRDIDSRILLRRTCELVRAKGFSIVNLDTTVFAQAPKISPHREQMREVVAETTGLETGCVNIKATTTEGLGMIGAGEGIAAMCVALLETG